MRFIRHPKTLIASLSLAAFFILLAFMTNGRVSDYFLNLSASFVTILFTVFFIDALLEREQAKRYREAYAVAREDVSQMIDAVKAHLEVPFKHVDTFERDFSAELKSFSDSNWLELSITLPLIVDEVSDRVREYAKLLPPESLGKLYALERAAKRARSKFAAHGGDVVDNREGRAEFAPRFARDIEELFSALDNFEQSLAAE